MATLPASQRDLRANVEVLDDVANGLTYARNQSQIP